MFYIVSLSWLLDPVIFLKLRRKYLFCKSEGIHKTTTIFTQNDKFVHTGQVFIKCHFVKFTQHLFSSQLEVNHVIQKPTEVNWNTHADHNGLISDRKRSYKH